MTAVYIHPVPPRSPAGPFAWACRLLLADCGFTIARSPAASAFAIAPHLARRLQPDEFNAPNHGTLIFHPSALPLHRGPDAIRWAIAAGERVSAATWFKATGDLDAGPIVASVPVVLKPGESAGRAYHSRFVPAGYEALHIAVCRYRAEGRFPLINQDESLATYEGRFDGSHPMLAEEAG